MSSISRVDFKTSSGGKSGGFQVRASGRGRTGRTLFLGDTRYGGPVRAREAAEEIRRAIDVLLEHFPALTWNSNGKGPAGTEP